MAHSITAPSLHHLNLRGIGAKVRLWAERRRTSKALARLDDTFLCDLDLTRAEAEREARRLFWRD
jgi:uncharacterized protein YjiS (DUF1127 family)